MNDNNEQDRNSLYFRPEGYTLDQEIEAYGAGLWPRDVRRWNFIRALWRAKSLGVSLGL